MRISKIVGFKPYDFRDEKTGRQVRGYSVWVTEEEDPSSGVCGLTAKKVSVNFDNLVNEFVPQVGADVIFYYNERQKVIDVKVI